MEKDDDQGNEDVALSVTRYQIMPSLISLLVMRNRLHLAYLGKKLMKWTALATGKELRRIALDIGGIIMNYELLIKDAFIMLAQCRFHYPGLNNVILESAPEDAMITFASTHRSVAGVKVLAFEVRQSGADGYEFLGMGRGGELIRRTKERWRKIVEVLIVMCQYRENFKLVDEANKSATKKQNVLKRLIVPKILETIKYILSELDEQEREESFRLKRFKQLKYKNLAEVEELATVVEEPPAPPKPPRVTIKQPPKPPCIKIEEPPSVEVFPCGEEEPPSPPPIPCIAKPEICTSLQAPCGKGEPTESLPAPCVTKMVQIPPESAAASPCASKVSEVEVCEYGVQTSSYASREPSVKSSETCICKSDMPKLPPETEMRLSLATKHLNEVIHLAEGVNAGIEIEGIIKSCQDIKSKINELSGDAQLLQDLKKSTSSVCGTSTKMPQFDDNLVCFEKSYKATFTVTKSINPDGTLSEEKQMVTIETEKRTTNYDKDTTSSRGGRSGGSDNDDSCSCAKSSRTTSRTPSKTSGPRTPSCTSKTSGPRTPSCTSKTNESRQASRTFRTSGSRTPSCTSKTSGPQTPNCTSKTSGSRTPSCTSKTSRSDTCNCEILRSCRDPIINHVFSRSSNYKAKCVSADPCDCGFPQHPYVVASTSSDTVISCSGSMRSTPFDSSKSSNIVKPCCDSKLSDTAKLYGSRAPSATSSKTSGTCACKIAKPFESREPSVSSSKTSGTCTCKIAKPFESREPSVSSSKTSDNCTCKTAKPYGASKSINIAELYNVSMSSDTVKPCGLLKSSDCCTSNLSDTIKPLRSALKSSNSAKPFGASKSSDNTKI